jgi:tetratricopeptide (TPR) repeat protein
MGAPYYLNRARYVVRGPEARERREQVRTDYQRVLELDPADAEIRAEYADALVTLGTPEDRAEALKQYKEALDWNERLRPEEPKRKAFESRAAEIRKKIEGK